MKDLGQLAYEAYGDQVGWHTYDQREMPTWETLAEPQRTGWGAAARTVVAAGRARQVAPTRPTVGRMVHYVSPAGACWAAVVTAVCESPALPPGAEPVSLVLFYPPGVPLVRDHERVEQDQTGGADDTIGKPGTWHWPERN